ncbi:FMN-binding negative transcriptional regulator [Sphingomonas solaris]|uniref:FMN-binding negative transcriptional regulator n=1 Tax=Alterirhizorhabdus solaris TaxID=2529389 RepID=A0A558QSN7_9SPHN|nr:FMN-binding negative transcriptional regulator [Sphingomonas solaris]TVV70134.1 FMN-binding negative transcriptional regulator [Sphingomonas solaris]
MHPDPAFRLNDEAAMRAFAARRAFAHIFAATPDGPTVVHAPVLVDDAGHLRFHLSRRNPMAALLDGARGIASLAGADGYVSPDWYGLPDQVPTWNYVAAEAHGTFRRLDAAETVAQLDALGTDHEARLAPKPAWTRSKMTPGRFEAMVGGIVGFRLVVAEWRGTAKLSQNKPAPARARVAAAFAAAGHGEMAALVAGAAA